MYQDLLDNLSPASEKRWHEGRPRLLDLLLHYTFNTSQLSEDAFEDALAAISDNNGATAAVLSVLMPPHLRRRTGSWWQILELLMELAAPYQTLEQFDKLREALAHGVAKGVHQNCISMAEGVADPIDAMFHGFEGSEWGPIDVCHADRDDNVKRFPTMIAEYYMGGIAADKVYEKMEDTCHIEETIQIFLDEACEQIEPMAARMIQRDKIVGKYDRRAKIPEKGVQHLWGMAAQLLMAGKGSDADLTEAQHWSRLVGNCATAYLQGTRDLLLYELKDAAPKLQELKLGALQEILRESCTVITSLHDFVDLGLRLTDNLLRRQYQANIVIEMVTLYLTNLVCLRAISLAACLDNVRAQHWPYTKYDLPESVELRVVVKLRIHLRDIAAGEFRPLRPSCPGLDPSVCFMDVPEFAADVGLIEQLPPVLPAQQGTPALPSIPDGAAAEAASQAAAAALLQEEEQATEAAQQAKHRKAAKKARQKQRKQAKIEPDLIGVQPELQENMVCSKPTACQATEGAVARGVGVDTTNLFTGSALPILAYTSCTGNAHEQDISSREEPDAALTASAQPRTPHNASSSTACPELLRYDHDSCQQVEESGLRHVIAERAEDVLDSCADCVICWERCADVVLQPCGHLCTCSACVAACLGSTFLCPMCRCTVADSIHI